MQVHFVVTSWIKRLSTGFSSACEVLLFGWSKTKVHIELSGCLDAGLFEPDEFFAVVGGRIALDALELAVEVGQGLKADLESDFAYAQIRAFSI